MLSSKAYTLPTERDTFETGLNILEKKFSISSGLFISSNVFLKAPNIFTIRYQTFNTNGEEILHPSLNIIKECALLTCDVQYTPDGTYMTYEDPYRTLTSYQLTLSFGELDPIYDSDYTQLDKDRDQVIGY